MSVMWSDREAIFVNIYMFQMTAVSAGIFDPRSFPVFRKRFFDVSRACRLARHTYFQFRTFNCINEFWLKIYRKNTVVGSVEMIRLIRIQRSVTLRDTVYFSGRLYKTLTF